MAVVDNLRTRLLALHLLERILPATQSMQEGEQASHTPLISQPKLCINENAWAFTHLHARYFLVLSPQNSLCDAIMWRPDISPYSPYLLCNEILPGDSDLWHTTLTYNPSPAKVKVNLHTKNQGHRSNGLAVRVVTDRQTHRRKDGPDSMTSISDAGGKKGGAPKQNYIMSCVQVAM